MRYKVGHDHSIVPEHWCPTAAWLARPKVCIINSPETVLDGSLLLQGNWMMSTSSAVVFAAVDVPSRGQVSARGNLVSPTCGPKESHCISFFFANANEGFLGLTEGMTAGDHTVTSLLCADIGGVL